MNMLRSKDAVWTSNLRSAWLYQTYLSQSQEEEVTKEADTAMDMVVAEVVAVLEVAVEEVNHTVVADNKALVAVEAARIEEQAVETDVVAVAVTITQYLSET